LIEEHTKRLEEVRARAQEVKEQIAAKVEECDELDRRVANSRRSSRLWRHNSSD